MAKTAKATAKFERPPVVLGYNKKEGHWLLIINAGSVSRHHELRTRSEVSKTEAIAEAKDILKRYGLKWTAKAKVLA